MSTDKKKAKKARNLAPIVHPLLAECAKATNDPYWSEIFDRAARGKFPKGFMFRDGELTFKRRTAIQRLALENEPRRAVEAAITFFRRHSSLSSQNDAIPDPEADAGPVKVTKTTWGQVRREAERKELLNSYIGALRAMFTLTDNEVTNLKTWLGFGFNLKIIRKEDVCLEGGKIINIRGLEFNPSTRLFTLDQNAINRSQPRNRKTQRKKQMGYLDDFYKYLKKIGYLPSGTNKTKGEEGTEVDSETESISVPLTPHITALRPPKEEEESDSDY